MPDYVLVFTNRLFKEEILFIEKDRPEFQKGRFNIPGGKIEKDDLSPLAAANRELIEETGYSLQGGRVAGLIRDTAREFNVYICKGVVNNKEEPQPREGETERPFWGLWSQIRKDPRLMPNLKIAVPLLMGGIEDFEIIWNEQTDMFAPSFEIVLKLKNEVVSQSPQLV